jgi:hypothetical protein
MRSYIAKQLLLYVFTCVGLIGRQLQVVGITEIEEVKTVPANQKEPFSKNIYFIQINIKHEYLVMEPMLCRLHPVVHYIRYV